MKKYTRSMGTALACFLVVIALNFFLPRMLPGNPIAYLTGFAEEDMTPRQYEYYRPALHLDESLPAQFMYYLQSLLDGSLGYSYKKEAVVSELIFDRLGKTLQITLPAVLLSAALGLVWGLSCGFHKNGLADRASTSLLIVLNALPTFLIALVLVIVFGFKTRWLPYAGLNSAGVPAGGAEYVLDRLRHLVLPVASLALAALPSRYLMMRNMAAQAADEKYVLYARARGLPPGLIERGYILRNIAQPFVTMAGMSVSTCVGGSLVIENVFSINGMGTLLSDAVYTLDYPLMQGILFVTTLIMVISIVAADIICVLIDPRVRWGERV